MRMTQILAATWLCRASMGFIAKTTTSSKQSANVGLPILCSGRIVTTHRSFMRLFSVSNGVQADVKMGVSRIETLQTLLSKHGAPGSLGCSKSDGDLEPIFVASDSELPPEDTPELISEFLGVNDYIDLHPHLFPLAKSKTSGNLICALRRAYADDASQWYENSSQAPWPIVEAKIGGPGMRLLALNSEHLMRRIVCECDFAGERTELIDLYNDQLGKNRIQDKALDQPYEPGSVKKLGYGVDKYVLLRVGPFPDIYESLALGHAKKADESSALISAEASNSKISGFASTFLFYAKLLSSFPNRNEEARDAARMCLRMPLPSIGLTVDDFREVAVLGQIADPSDSDEEVLAKLQVMYEKMRDHENNDPRSSGNNDMTPEQIALDEANHLLDTTALTGAKWSAIRSKLAEIYKSVGRNDMAAFVNHKSS